MTPRATGVVGCGKPDGTAVLAVTGYAAWSRKLICVMNRAVVTSQARLVGGRLAERSRCGNVARSAMIRQNYVGSRKAAGLIDVLFACDSKPENPQQRGRRDGDGERKAKPPHGLGPPEIFQVDPLCQLFCCAPSSHHSRPAEAFRIAVPLRRAHCRATTAPKRAAREPAASRATGGGVALGGRAAGILRRCLPGTRRTLARRVTAPCATFETLNARDICGRAARPSSPPEGEPGATL